MMSQPLVQRVGLTFEYPVVFTRDAFDAANEVLAQTLSRREQRRHRVPVLIDSAVAEGRPALLTQIERYAHHGDEWIELAGRPWIVTGGEAAKHDDSSQSFIAASRGSTSAGSPTWSRSAGERCSMSSVMRLRPCTAECG